MRGNLEFPLTARFRSLGYPSERFPFHFSGLTLLGIKGCESHSPTFDSGIRERIDLKVELQLTPVYVTRSHGLSVFPKIEIGRFVFVRQVGAAFTNPLISNSLQFGTHE